MPIRESSMNHDRREGIERGEAHEPCDGCCRPHPASELSLIGDGAIKVCRTCRKKAAAIVRE